MAARKVLIVDDSMTSRQVLGDEVEELGYVARAVESAEEALQLPSWDRYDAYLLDIRLPGMSGFELLHRIKQVRPNAPVVLITQFEFARPDRVVLAYESVWFCRKPADLHTLAGILKNAFEAEELRADVERLRSLAVGIKSVGLVKDLDQEFKVLLHLAADSVTADAGAIFLRLDDESLQLRVGVGLPGGGEHPPEVAQGALLRCLERQESVRVENARVSRMPELHRLFPGVGRLHLLCIPLTAGHKLIGVLALYRDAERAPFREKEGALARLYAATAAVALENLRLSENAEAAYRHRVDAQRELIQSRKLSSLGQVTAGLAHEIRNPLTVILGNLDLIEKRAQGPGLDTYLERIRGQCDRVLRLVSDLKGVYHPGDAPRGPFRLRELVREALALAPAPGPEVEVALGEPPEQDGIEGDMTQLLQVMVNLLSNAYQALGAAGGTVTIEYLAEDAGSAPTLVLRDSGPGIPPEIRARVFDPFFTTKGEAGTGLGLWISATILRSHGGALEVVDHPEGGACFHLRFARPSLGVSTPIPESGPLPDASGAAGPLARVLVVDDEDEVRDYLGELLQSEGYTAGEASTLEEATRRLEAEDWDLVILDSKLSDGRGEEFFAQVIRPRYDLPAILFTGSDELDTGELLVAGLAAVVRKPARSRRLLEAVRRALLEYVRPAGQGL